MRSHNLSLVSTGFSRGDPADNVQDTDDRRLFAIGDGRRELRTRLRMHHGSSSWRNGLPETTERNNVTRNERWMVLTKPIRQS